MTSTINFIDSVIRNLKPEKTRKVYWCNGCPGFGIRITPSGTKTFIYKFMSGRKSRWLTIGKYPQWTIRKARSEYDKYYEQVNDYGMDPIAQTQEAEAKKRDRKKVSEFLETYLETGHLKGKTGMDDEKSAFKRDVLPVIGDKFLDEVNSEDIDAIQRNILNRAKSRNKRNKNVARRSGKSSVKHTLSYTRQFFELAKRKKQGIASNPVDGVDPLGSSSVRERILNFKEIWLFWNGIEQTGCPPVMSFALKFLLTTMQRSKEVRTMRYSAYKEEEQTLYTPLQKRGYLPLTP